VGGCSKMSLALKRQNEGLTIFATNEHFAVTRDGLARPSQSFLLQRLSSNIPAEQLGYQPTERKSRGSYGRAMTS